jgi:hypothetical protein
MKTTIESDLRVFMVLTNTGKTAFCNIQDLNMVVKEMKCKEGYFAIYDIWNNKPRKVTQKSLNLFFEGAGLTQYFFY